MEPLIRRAGHRLPEGIRDSADFRIQIRARAGLTEIDLSTVPPATEFRCTCGTYWISEASRLVILSLVSRERID